MSKLWYEKAGGRKFIAVMFAMTCSFVLSLMMRIGTEWTTIVTICVGAFVAGNTLTTIKTSGSTTPPPEPPTNEG